MLEEAAAGWEAENKRFETREVDGHETWGSDPGGQVGASLPDCRASIRQFADLS